MEWPKMDPSIEIYPMPAFPRLDVSDLDASSRWYQEVLGFEHVATYPGSNGQPCLVHLRWAKYADLFLKPADVPATGAREHGVVLYFSVSDNRIDALAHQCRECRVADSAIVEEPIDLPWNCRQVIVADPDGYRLAFFHGPLKPMTWDDMGQQVMSAGG